MWISTERGIVAPPPALTATAVHVWLLSCNQPPSAFQVLASTLDDSERARAGRYHFERDRRRFVAARGMLRRLLSAYTNRPASALRFTYGSAGKPELEQPGVGAPRVTFNLAHSGDWALVGVTAGAPIGVDIEVVRKVPEHEDILRRHFGAAEVQSLLRLHSASQAERFLVGWTLKEAYVKAVGDGLSSQLPRFDVLTDPGFVRIERQPAAWERAPGWQLLRLSPQAGTVAALAVQMTQPELSCFRR